MKSQYKTPDQVEFTDLIRELKERFHYNQNRIAEVAKISPSMVSQIVQGTRNPGRPSVELLRREHRRLSGEAEPAPAGAEWEKGLVDELQGLREEDRKRVLDAVKAMTRGLPRKYPEHGPSGAELNERRVSSQPAEAETSSAGPSSVEDLVKKAVAEVQQPGVIYGRKRRAGGPSGKTS